MAGDWIKFEVATSDKPEVWEIAAALNIDPDAVVGKLVRVWSWFDAHTETGNAKSVSKLLLDRLVGVTGFCEAVIKSGWMLDMAGILSLPNFDRHNGKTAKTRVLTAKRVANHKAKSNADGNDDSVSDALPKEEKRREDKKKTMFSSEDMRLAEFILEGVLQVSPDFKKPKKLDRWANTVRLMREQDNLEHRYIAEIFKFANRDSFWKTNILSPDKLREKFSQLSAKKLEAANGQRNQHSGSIQTDKAELAADFAFGPDARTNTILEGSFDRVDPYETPH